MRRFIKDLLVRVSGGPRCQQFLERNVAFSQYLMGIGSGESVNSSGEAVLVRKLEELYASARRALRVFDVGSNEGQFLRLVVEGLPGVPIEVHAFEPGRHTYEKLVGNAGRYPGVVLNNLGLGKQRGEVELFYDEAGSGLASLHRRRLDHFGIRFGHSETVRIESLDGYCKERGVEHIDLLKLDVEGHELEVLQGSVEMLRGRRVGMLSFEFGGCNIDSRTYFQDFWYFFKEHGVGEIFRILPSGDLAPVRQYRELHEQFRTTNFLVMLG